MGIKIPLEWYQRNRKKYWVIVFLTVGFEIGLPFVIFGIILEIAYQKNRNLLRQTDQQGIDKENGEFERLEDEIQSESKKTNKILFACPECGSRHIKSYRSAPYSIKEYHCEDCEYIGTHAKKIYTKKRKTHYLCSNCGSCNVNLYLGFTGQYRCMDCDYIGFPILTEDAKQMSCPNCGEKLEEDIMLCSKCGIEIEEEEER